MEKRLELVCLFTKETVQAEDECDMGRLGIWGRRARIGGEKLKISEEEGGCYVGSLGFFLGGGVSVVRWEFSL